MFKKILGLGILLSLVSLVYAQEEKITITTYYPSPYGSYRELRSQRMAIGDGYINHSSVCWEGDTGCSGSPMIPSTSDVDLIVQGNVGIGTRSPAVYNKLQVDGGWLLVRFSGSTSWGDKSARIGVYKTDNTASVGPWHMSQNDDGKFAIHQNSVGDRLTIDSNGNVGIGTQAPSRALSVLSADNSDHGQIFIQNSGGGPFMTIGPDRLNTNATFFLQNNNSYNLSLVNGGGNVGIGTPTPTSVASPANGATRGNLDVNDVYLRSINNWASQAGVGNIYYAMGNDNISVTSATWNDMKDMTINLPSNFTGGRVYIHFDASIRKGNCRFLLRFLLDNTQPLIQTPKIDLAPGVNDPGNGFIIGAPTSLSYVIGNLSSGSHTIKVQWCNEGGGTTYQDGAVSARVMTAIVGG